MQMFEKVGGDSHVQESKRRCFEALDILFFVLGVK